eukprot:SAG31_NODE_3862_length_3810_cov_32.413096_5_plen_115_part_00
MGPRIDRAARTRARDAAPLIPDAVQIISMAGSNTASAAAAAAGIAGVRASLLLLAMACCYASGQLTTELIEVDFNHSLPATIRPIARITIGQVRSYFLVVVPTIREMREFYREM